MKPNNLHTASLAAGLGLALGGFSASALAVPTPGEFSPVAIYEDTQGAFGLAYNPDDDVVHWTQGDAGDGLVHSMTPYKNIDTSGLPTGPRGEYRISPVAGGQDAFGTTDPTANAGATSAYFDALGYDTASGRIVDSSGDTGMQAYDPLTAANFDADFRTGEAVGGFKDGLDIDGSNTWSSGDIQDIQKNGSQFIDDTVTLPSWSGLGGDGSSADTLGFSGVEQVGDSLFAVGVMNFSDAGRSRTILRFDANNGDFLGFDPDGDPIAARWEDLAFDGEFLYAADLRGDANEAGVEGDIYVFNVTGGLDPDPNPDGQVPAPAPLALLGIGLVAMGPMRRRVARQ